MRRFLDSAATPARKWFSILTIPALALILLGLASAQPRPALAFGLGPPAVWVQCVDLEANPYGLQPSGDDSVFWELHFSEPVASTGAQEIEITGQDGTTVYGVAFGGGSGGGSGNFDDLWRYGTTPYATPHLVSGGPAVVSDVNGVVISVPAGGWQDQDGNPNSAAPSPLYLAHDWKVSVSDATATEGTDETIDFEVTLNARDDCATVTVDWATADGTTIAGEDYTVASGTITFGPGETTKTVSIVVLDDAVHDSGETFALQLSNASGATISDGEATGTILNSESGATEPPSATVSREEEGWVWGEFDVTVTFSAPTSGFAMSELEVTNGSVMRMSSLEDGTQHTVTVAPNDGSGSDIAIRVPAGVATDAAGNSNTASAEFWILLLPEAPSIVGAPSVTVSCWDTEANHGSQPGGSWGSKPFSVFAKIEFSETVFGFSAPGNIAFTQNGATVGVVGIGSAGYPSYAPHEDELGSREFDFGAVPVDDVSGAVVVSVPAGVARDRDGELNTASNQLHIAHNWSVSVADSSATEGTDATIDFEVTLNARDDCRTATVDWTTADGTATAGEDYTAASGTLTFAPGETTKTISVAILDDATEDSGETVLLRLSNATGATLADTEATGTIRNSEEPAATSGFTASFEGMPAEHNGSSIFTFELRFSEEFAISYRTVRDSVLQVSGGTVKRAKRLNKPSNMGWRIYVKPTTDGDVAIALPTGRACGETGAVCTDDGRLLSNALALTVPGPASPDNRAPTGLPEITGTARVGQTLTASVDGIEDADGLTGVTFAHQWLWQDGTTETEIAGATESTYTLTAAEEDRTVTVRVTFTDGRGTEETLVSTPTAAVAGPGVATAVSLPEVSIAEVSSPVTEGTDAAFVVTRTDDTASALTVTVEVTESGAMVKGAAPTEVTFGAGANTASFAVETEDDEAVEAASTITASLGAGNGYTVSAAGGSAEVTAEDDDAAPTVATASPTLVPENGTAVATLEATDADTPAADLAWSIAAGADAGAFSLTADGVLAFQAAKDFEAPDDADGDGDYEVTVSVSDAANTAEAALTVRLTDVDDTAPGVTKATVNGAALTLTFDEPLDGGSVPPADAFAVEVDDAARAVDTVALAGNMATLTLASPVAAGATVAAGYTPPTGASATPLRDAAGNAVAGFSGHEVANEAVNAASTGLPTISGTAQVDETLTASVDGIEDADGLTGVTFSYQWVSNDETAGTDIQDATEASYTLVAGDAGKTVKVRVTFTDGGGERGDAGER